jgi:hypothetical protein
LPYPRGADPDHAIAGLDTREVDRPVAEPGEHAICQREEVTVVIDELRIDDCHVLSRVPPQERSAMLAIPRPAAAKLRSFVIRDVR